MEKATGKTCCDCRSGEHDNYDDNIRLAVVRDPGTGQIHKRGYLCEHHREIYLDDGFTVEAREAI